MKNEFYFPNKCKRIGVVFFLAALTTWILILAGVLEESLFKAPVLAIYENNFMGGKGFFHIIQNEIFDELIGVLALIGLIFIGFSKEKQEDEFVQKIRLNSLKWAVFVNYGLLLFAMLFVYGMVFLDIMLYNMFTVLIIYIIRFNYLMYKFNRHEE
jgi:hypothetical protein